VEYESCFSQNTKGHAGDKPLKLMALSALASSAIVLPTYITKKTRDNDDP
jgi:hypothetical protein